MPCLEVGKCWRVRREALEHFLKERERSSTLVGQLGSFLRVPGNVLAIAQNLDLLHWLDAAFFRVGEARDGLLVTFDGGENSPPEELMASFEENGLAAGRLKWKGRSPRSVSAIPHAPPHTPGITPPGRPVRGRSRQHPSQTDGDMRDGGCVGA